MIVLDKRLRILSRMFLSSFSDNRFFSSFKSTTESTTLSAATCKFSQKEQCESSHCSAASGHMQHNTRQINDSNVGSSQPFLLSSGATYSGHKSRANLVISVISCVELTTDGMNEFIIEAYNQSFSFDLS